MRWYGLDLQSCFGSGLGCGRFGGESAKKISRNIWQIGKSFAPLHSQSEKKPHEQWSTEPEEAPRVL